MRILKMLFAFALVALVAVALVCAAVVPDLDVEVEPLAACSMSCAECPQNAGEIEVTADLSDANYECVESASLTFTIKETDVRNDGTCDYSGDARTATFTSGRYSGAGV